MIFETKKNLTKRTGSHFHSTHLETPSFGENCTVLEIGKLLSKGSVARNSNLVSARANLKYNLC